MANLPNPNEPTEHSPFGVASSQHKHGSVVATWIGFYLFAGVLLLFTMPATSHSNNWSGILPAFLILMFGAYRLARVGAKISKTFIYGCSTTVLFLFRFLSMGRFSLWLEYQAPPTPMLAVMWIAICLFLGGATSGMAYMVHENENRLKQGQDTDT
ncbi:hypothetical protein [Rosistilla oblonga]|uniref:hypothetical protein n=1 Tax=Rosistilla oblonga TaxID=2527990 RepID=UPI003A96EA9B